MVADGTIPPVDEFGTVEVDLNQSGTTTTPVKMVAVAYVSGLLRNLLSTRKAVEQWGKLLASYKTKTFWGSMERNRSCLTSASARDCFPQQV